MTVALAGTMPSFFKDLKDFRRRSRASFRLDKPSVSHENISSENTSNVSDSSEVSNGTVATEQSSSTLSSVNGTSASHSSPYPLSNGSTPRVNGTASRPLNRMSTISSGTNRYSMVDISPGSGNGSSTPKLPLSQYAPRVTSIFDGSQVYQKVLLIQGQMGDLSQRPLDGTVIVTHHQDTFPQTSWPVSESHFKALIHLNPGRNVIRLDFFSPKLTQSDAFRSQHSSKIMVHYTPMISAPPLQLVILLGKDSPATFDAIPERVKREGNDLSVAIRKFRMAGHLWQAFTAEHMYRHELSRRCFRFEEEWQTGTLSSQDKLTGQMRNETKVHVVRMNKTVAEIRDAQVAQQNVNAPNRGGELFDAAKEAVREYFKPAPGQVQYIAGLLLDTHWDKQQNLITGHAALGLGSDDIRLGIFGSHALQSYPSSIDEVVPAFTDCTRTDTDYVANDCGDSGSSWEAANIGIGAHLHEVGHVFGCPHQESGIMERAALHFNRTFLIREVYSTRTQEKGALVKFGEEGCSWHRLDALRFRCHPCFRIPYDSAVKAEDGVQVWAIDNGRVMLTARSGIAFVELYAEGDSVSTVWIDYMGADLKEGPPVQVTLTENDLRARLPPDRKNKTLRLEIYSVAQGKHVVSDLSQLTSKKALVKLPRNKIGFRGSKLGDSMMQGSQPEEIILSSAVDKTKLLRSIKVYHGYAFDGIEFFYEDSTSQLFGKRGGEGGGSEFVFDTRKGEVLSGFYVRAGQWIDGIAILTSMGRRSETFGNATGGSGHTMIAPRGYTIAGIAGTCGPWVDGFSLIITR